ncbi:hypothetical protein BaRGS_00007154 [Batillaria attramentaria]|uniref:Uncharacterized protein n=1 Tax=Batillaria attramentaria TaxID=370345 RepID=A0ABD0LRP7_9CAEN
MSQLTRPTHNTAQRYTATVDELHVTASPGQPHLVLTGGETTTRVALVHDIADRIRLYHSPLCQAREWSHRKFDAPAGLSQAE